MYANGLDLNQRLGGESGSCFVGKSNECIIIGDLVIGLCKNVREKGMGNAFDQLLHLM